MEFVLSWTALPVATPSGAERASTALTMFLVVVLLFGLFMLGLVLIWAARRMRRAATLPRSEEPMADPWQESARRLEPYRPDESSTD